MVDTAQHLADIKAIVQRAAKEAGREGDDITLVAVSKTHARARIERDHAVARLPGFLEELYTEVLR